MTAVSSSGNAEGKAMKNGEKPTGDRIAISCAMPLIR